MQTHILHETVPFMYTQYRIETDFENNLSYVNLQRMVSRAPGQIGAGTNAFRTIMKFSFDNQCQGNIHCTAAWSSHIFYLKMGMIPEDRVINPVRLYFGINGEKCLEKFLDDEVCEHEDIATLSRMLLLARGYNIEFDKNLPTIDKFDLYVSKDELLEFQVTKKFTFIKHSFIPQLLQILKSNINDPRPNTNGFGSINMKMSTLGIERWKSVLEQNLEFKSLRNFEVLHPYMSQETLNELNDILALRG